MAGILNNGVSTIETVTVCFIDIAISHLTAPTLLYCIVYSYLKQDQVLEIKSLTWSTLAVCFDLRVCAKKNTPSAN